MSNKPSLAIISTYGDLCGIAGYTYWLKEQLAEDFEVQVFPLDQNLLKRVSKNGVRQGDVHIKEIAEKLQQFQYINLQFEPGTLGPDIYRALKRFQVLIDKAPNMTVTFHTVVREMAPGWLQKIRSLLRGRVRETINLVRLNFQVAAWDRIYRSVKDAGKQKPISSIVHTRREADFLRIEKGFSNVYDHPLAFLKESDAGEFRESASRSDFPVIQNLKGDAKFIGVFGFIAPYKGALTAIKALSYLPDDYHLLVFGGVHPNEIRQGVSVFPYLDDIQSEIERQYLTESQGVSSDSLAERKKPVTESRIHFMGAVDDPEFLKGMALCDYVLFPYEEVGQSASGPIAMALEMETPIFISRNLMSKQLAKYFPQHFTEFDIGAHLQLAQYIYSGNAVPPGERDYDWKTNRRTYVSAITGQE